ncbi:50S ribosomal protein L6 [Hyphococcus luteus]|uniref:Large ribosomal subunit protein uL6 n=1 Tax=Hyphococcus luteus TaxID=2058213 RepID=A0A2S7JYU2_9PROT|nr:50S ribosomal protein L6 [Marinicaulis flavus]PQA85419.1 50S ribosomal protein L6 [Marinicaulis flavus]
MSRIGKRSIPVPSGVTVNVDGQTVSAKGPKGELKFVVNDLCTVALEDDAVTVKPVNDSKPARSLWGMSRTQIANMFEGVANEFTKTLELVGVGYRAQMKGTSLNLALGYSHEIDYPAPDGVKIATPKPTEVVLSGIDKQKVGQAAAEIRGMRPPEPYKGKGVKYADEYIFRKEGKKK